MSKSGILAVILILISWHQDLQAQPPEQNLGALITRFLTKENMELPNKLAQKQVKKIFTQPKTTLHFVKQFPLNYEWKPVGPYDTIAKNKPLEVYISQIDDNYLIGLIVHPPLGDGVTDFNYMPLFISRKDSLILIPFFDSGTDSSIYSFSSFNAMTVLNWKIQEVGRYIRDHCGCWSEDIDLFATEDYVCSIKIHKNNEWINYGVKKPLIINRLDFDEMHLDDWFAHFLYYCRNPENSDLCVKSGTEKENPVMTSPFFKDLRQLFVN